MGLSVLPKLPIPDLSPVINMNHTVRADGRTLPLPGPSLTVHHVATYSSHSRIVADTGRPSLAMSTAGDHRQSFGFAPTPSQQFSSLDSRFTEQGLF